MIKTYKNLLCRLIRCRAVVALQKLPSVLLPSGHPDDAPVEANVAAHEAAALDSGDADNMRPPQRATTSAGTSRHQADATIVPPASQVPVPPAPSHSRSALSPIEQNTLDAILLRGTTKANTAAAKKAAASAKRLAATAAAKKTTSTNMLPKEKRKRYDEDRDEASDHGSQSLSYDVDLDEIDDVAPPQKKPKTN